MRGKLIAILSCGCLLIAVAMVAQDIPSDEIFWGSRPYVPEIVGSPAIRVQSDLVEVPTVVRDRHGSPVGNLKKEDFVLLDNGKPQTISTFVVLTGPGNVAGPGAPGVAPYGASPIQPRYVALYFDDVNMVLSDLAATIADLTFARDGAIKFVRKGLDPGERVGIFTASAALNLDFTDDVPKLLETLGKLRLFQRMPDQRPGACPMMNAHEAWMIIHAGQGTLEFQAALQRAKLCRCFAGNPEICVMREAESSITVAEDWSLDTLDSLSSAVRHLGEMPGKRVLILTSTGFITQSFVQKQQKIVEAALHASVVINSLSTEGVGGGFNPLSDPLANIAEGTGGQFFHNGNDIENAFRTLSTPPSVSYVLGFSPGNLKADGLEHNLKVKLAGQEHMTVSARPGYYAPSLELSPSEKRFRKLGQSVLASDSPSEIQIEFTATPETLASGERALKVLVHVDVRKLPFQVLSDRHVERLIFITALFDEKNQFLTGVRGVMDLRLKDVTLKQLSTQGLDAKLSISAPSGSYRVREVVQEAVGGRISAVSREVTIR
jgi:VWFA-related protein